MTIYFVYFYNKQNKTEDFFAHFYGYQNKIDTRYTMTIFLFIFMEIEKKIHKFVTPRRIFFAIKF